MVVGCPYILSLCRTQLACPMFPLVSLPVFNRLACVLLLKSAPNRPEMGLPVPPSNNHSHALFYRRHLDVSVTSIASRTQSNWLPTCCSASTPANTSVILISCRRVFQFPFFALPSRWGKLFIVRCCPARIAGGHHESSLRSSQPFDVFRDLLAP